MNLVTADSEKGYKRDWHHSAGGSKQCCFKPRLTVWWL